MTGSRGPLSKPDDRRQRRNKRPPLVLDGARTKAPSAPGYYLDITRKRWGAYWVSEFAQVVRVSQMPMIYRLFDRYDERERAMRVVRKQGRVVDGSQGQLVQHPLLKYIDSCDAAIVVLEDRLGLSPRGAAALGIGLAKAKKSLDEINAAMRADDDGSDESHQAEEPDPRIAGSIGAGAR